MSPHTAILKENFKENVKRFLVSESGDAKFFAEILLTHRSKLTCHFLV